MFFILNEGKSQTSSFPERPIKDTVFIGYNEGKYYLSHPIKKEDNLSSIASYYGSSLSAIRELNSMTDSQLKANKTIKIPITYKSVKSPVQRSSFEKYTYIPVFYKVKKGDTVYRLFRIYFPRDSNEIKEINLIKNNVLKTDSKLLIGYFIDQSISKSPVDLSLQSNRKKDTLSLTSDKSKKVYKQLCLDEGYDFYNHNAEIDNENSFSLNLFKIYKLFRDCRLITSKASIANLNRIFF